ncbi:MAG: nucleotide exchange factor GrpE [Nitrospinota bacterium]
MCPEDPEGTGPAPAPRGGSSPPGDSPSAPAPRPAAGEEGKPAQPDVDYRDLYLRLRAEFDNFRKREHREREAFRLQAHRELVAALLPILDDLERAAAHMGAEEVGGVVRGVELIAASLRELLRRQGLEPIAALGESFDPERHEALLAVESADHPDNTVIEEHQRGYLLRGEVLRPARVTVARSVPQAEG